MIKFTSREDTVFRNELLFACDAKTINIDNTFINLFMLLKHNGVRPRQKARSKSKSLIDIERLIHIFKELEKEGVIKGSEENELGLKLWIRSNLSNMTSRGSLDKEKISSLLPIHLESYRVRNAAHCRDYFSSDQLYLMLSADPRVKDELKNYLGDGWDQTTDKLTVNSNVDVDCLGVLHLIKNLKPGFLDSSSTINRIKPLLEESSILYTKDIHHLLVYKGVIPRNVLLTYIKIISAFHLSLYFQKIVFKLPSLLEIEFTESTFEEFEVLLDVTNNPDSGMAKMSAGKVQLFLNKYYDYIRAGFRINAALKEQGLNNNDSKNLDIAISRIKERPDDFEAYFRHKWNHITSGIDEDDKEFVEHLSKYESSFFDKYIELLVHARGGYLYKYNLQMFDTLSMKNSPSGFLAQGKSKKHPRRFVLGTSLLEVLVQIMVLKVDSGSFVTKPIGIDEFTKSLYERYGVIIDGSNLENYKGADLSDLSAFKENSMALRNKLRQIGFYDDLSDAHILQKISPRYELR